MKLLRFGPAGHERPGILDSNGVIRDAGTLVEDWAEKALDPDALARLAEVDPGSLPEVPSDVRLGPCVGAVGSFVCVGLNYRDHAAEAKLALPKEPILFMKSTGAIAGPNDPIVIPQGSTKTDWEVELGIVIGRWARRVSEADAPRHVAGFCTVNDVSERDFQINHAGQWVKGKSADSFGPIGPFIATPDEVADVQALSLWLDVNGERMQDGSTADMIAGAYALVSYISRFFTLRPGDVVATGTPAGVGMGRNPPRYLAPGDVVRLEVEGLGIQEHRVVAEG